MAKPSDKFKVGNWVRVKPAPPTDKELLRVPHNKRRDSSYRTADYETTAGGIYQIAEVCDGDFTICLIVGHYRRWFAPDWLITIDDPDRVREQDLMFKEGLRQMNAADRRRDEIFKHIFSPWWVIKKEKKR